MALTKNFDQLTQLVMEIKLIVAEFKPIDPFTSQIVMMNLYNRKRNEQIRYRKCRMASATGGRGSITQSAGLHSWSTNSDMASCMPR